MQTNVKLKTLLEGLSGKGIEIRVSSLARYTAENGVLVGISCGRARGRFSLSPKLLGLAPDRWDKECKAFYGEHVSMGRLNMVPKELEDRLNQLDTKARRILQAHTVNGTYMPLAEFEDFKAEFEETREEYFRTIQEVVGQWDKIRDDFIAGVRRTVETRGRRTTLKRDRERMVREIISAIPTAREYEARAKMEVTVRAFPTIGAATAGLEPDIQGLVDKTWRDDVTANIVRSIEMNLGEIFPGLRNRGQLRQDRQGGDQEPQRPGPHRAPGEEDERLRQPAAGTTGRDPLHGHQRRFGEGGVPSGRGYRGRLELRQGHRHQPGHARLPLR